MDRRLKTQLFGYHHIRCTTLFWIGVLALVSTNEFYPRSVEAMPNSRGPLKIGFVVVGPLHDSGWNEAHNQGRLFVESALGKEVQTTIVENVPENAEAERVMEKMIAQGNRLIFCTSFGFMEPAMRVAKRHPDVIFMQVNRLGGTKNVGTYTGLICEPMYITGVVAGRVTRTNKLGFVAGYPIPQILREINAYTLGVRSVNPKATVHVVWINSWNDSAAESEAAQALLESGADTLAYIGTGYATVLLPAERKGAFSVGANGDVHKFVPKGWLTGACWNWGPLYLKIAKSVSDHTWKTSSGYYGIQDECVKLASFGSTVPKSVRHEALELEKKMKQGKFTVFQAPLKDRDGKERLAAGQKVDAKWLANMDWFVVGVEGSLPKK